MNPAGQVGSEPIPKGQPFTYSVRAQGRLTTSEEFENIVVRETPDTGIVRVSDVARVELGAQDYSWTGQLDGKPSATVAIYQLPGSNAVDTAAGVRKLFAEAKQRFPDDVDYSIPIDTTLAVNEGIKEIVETLLIAIGLVVLVVFIFLQGWRSTLIPLLADPVALVGTQLSSLFSGPHSAWSLVPQLTQPILTAGVIKSSVRLAQAQRDEAVVQYQKTIQTAFTEVSDALIAHKRRRESREKQESLVEALEDRKHLAYTFMRYRAGSPAGANSGFRQMHRDPARLEPKPLAGLLASAEIPTGATRQPALASTWPPMFSSG